MATLELLLDRRNRWHQGINLEVFSGVKDIFRNHLPTLASHKEHFMLTEGAEIPVPLFEFELQELFSEATVKSGCKWWCENSRPSVAVQRTVKSLCTARFHCRHAGDHYEKKATNNSRASRHILRCACPASCVMKAISVRFHEHLS